MAVSSTCTGAYAGRYLVVILITETSGRCLSTVLTPVENADNYTRAVEFSIDEVNMEVRQVWDYGRDDGERLFAHFIGDVDWLDTTGNVLVHFGGTSFTDGVR